MSRDGSIRWTLCWTQSPQLKTLTSLTHSLEWRLGQCSRSNGTHPPAYLHPDRHVHALLMAVLGLYGHTCTPPDATELVHNTRSPHHAPTLTTPPHLAGGRGAFGRGDGGCGECNREPTPRCRGSIHRDDGAGAQCNRQAGRCRRGVSTWDIDKRAGRPPPPQRRVV